MKAIIVTAENKAKNSDLFQGLEVGDIKVFPSLPNIWNNSMPFLNANETDAEINGFFDYEKPIITEFQEYTDIQKVGNKFIHQFRDLTQSEIEAKIYEQNKTLRIHKINNSFDVNKDLVSNVSIESEKIYNEFNGLKECTKYVNDLGQLVAQKNFELFEQDGNKGTKLTIDFYDDNEEIGATSYTTDYYDDQRIKTFKGKCTIRVYERLLWDFDVEIGQLAYIVENYTDAEKQQVIQDMGLPSIEALNAMPTLLTSLFDDLFKVQLKDQIDLMYKTGDSTELFNAISVLDYSPLDQQALTSEQAVKYTYRQILQAKFNPQNFDFYA